MNFTKNIKGKMKKEDNQSLSKTIDELAQCGTKKDVMHHLLDKIKENWHIDDELEYEIRHAMAHYAVSSFLKKQVLDEAIQIASEESFEDFLEKNKKCLKKQTEIETTN